MTITHISLKNWKNFTHVDVDINQRLFIVGANAAGKSNLLDSFRFLRDITKQGGGLQYAISSRGGLSKIRSLSARKEPDVEISITVQDGDTKWFYLLNIVQENRGLHSIKVAKEIVKKNDAILVERPNNNDKDDAEQLTQTYLEQITTNKEFRDLVKFFSNIQYLHVVPQLLKFPDAFNGSDLPDDPFGKGFLQKIAHTPEKTRNKWLNKIQEALSQTVPQLTDIKYTEDAGIPHLEVLCKNWRSHDSKQNETQLSDGTLRIIGLLWSLFENNGLLLLEEPELSLHSAVVENLANILYTAQKAKKRQIILTTHSYELLSDGGISLSEILVLEPTENGTKAYIASTKEDIVALLEAGFSPAESVYPSTNSQIKTISGDLFN